MFNEFHECKLPLYSLNLEIITLVPKQKEVKQMRQYRPICLLNVSIKVFKKVVVSRIATLAQKVINPSQNVFLSRRNILEGVAILHQTLHEINRKKLHGEVLKLYFEKAYDKVN